MFYPSLLFWSLYEDRTHSNLQDWAYCNSKIDTCPDISTNLSASTFFDSAWSFYCTKCRQIAICEGKKNQIKDFEPIETEQPYWGYFKVNKKEGRYKNNSCSWTDIYSMYF